MSDLKDETLRRAQELADFKLLSSGDIPKIDLYMEQVTSLINTYSKQGVHPARKTNATTAAISLR